MGNFVTSTNKILEAIGGAKTIGVNGLDCAGKTTFAHALVAAYEERAIESRLLHVDDFNDISMQDQIYSAFSARNFSEELLEAYYTSSVDYDALGAAIKSETMKTKGVLIVEGVFLFKPRLDHLFDYKIFIEIDAVKARARYDERKARIGDKRRIEVFDQIWLPAFQRYCSEFSPMEKADFCVKA